ncbi:Wadjet anti-phage system protein JetD domain-containing protein [Actinosynnema sp. NPDC051121]
MEEVGDGYFSRIGQGDLLLVVENSATWHSVVSWLRGDHDVGAVAWGLGRAFTRSIASLSERHRISRIRYFGDLDPSGLDIPTKAAVYARELGLPEIQPAARLYRALLSAGRDRPGTEKPMTPSGAAALASWLPEDCRLAADTLVAGRRIAQEWVGYRYLQQNDDWLTDLGGESASDAPGGAPL